MIKILTAILITLLVIFFVWQFCLAIDSKLKQSMIGWGCDIYNRNILIGR